METRLLRKWVNAPSTLHVDHALHGTNVLIGDPDWRTTDKYITCYFLSGPVHSQRIAKAVLAEGWKAGTRR